MSNSKAADHQAAYGAIPDARSAFRDAGKTPNAARLTFVPQDTAIDAIPGLDEHARSWLKSGGFKPAAKKTALLPSRDGAIAGAVLGIGDGETGEPCGPAVLLTGHLAQVLPAGDYALAEDIADKKLASIAWGLGAYRFEAYKARDKTNGGGEGDASNSARPRLVLPDGPDRASILNTVEAVWFGRNLINTPASDLGPAELEAAARTLAARHNANIEVTTGDDLLAANFPMIHAVGRASDRAPRLIDLTWRKDGGSSSARTITIVGKGICFDTGGLDLKPAAGMLLMKKDMGGAASSLALAHMIMGHGLDVRLRVLIPAAENSVSGNAFRPSDILQSRLGKTVEVGNTDAEGRLVLADALALADADKPDTLISMATLTGAARVALGPDLPAFFSTDDAFAGDVTAAGQAIGDPLWRMPFWPGYDRTLESRVADMSNISDGPFGGAITAALFLKRFVSQARCYAHIDLYGWRPSANALCPGGGEPHAARAVFETLRAQLATNAKA